MYVFDVIVILAVVLFGTYLVFIVATMPEDQTDFNRALVDLNHYNSCTSLIVFNDDLANYNLPPAQLTKLHNIVLYKLGALKCP